MALNKLKKWIGTQAMTAFFDQLNDNVDATNAAIDLAEQNGADMARLASYNEPASSPYDSGDNGWRTINGIGFYYIGTANDYPASNGVLVHIRLTGYTSLVFQMFLASSGTLWTRRVIASTDFVDATWVQV